METHYLLVLLLLLITLHNSEQQGLIIHPPQDVIICAGDDVNITCGHNYTASLTPLWRINGQAISGSKIGTNNTFEMTVVADNIDTVLTVYSANEILNQTKFQCEFTFLPPVKSSVGILTVMGPPTLPVINVLERRLTSLVISWDTFSHTSCGDVTYNVTLSDGTAELVEERTTTSNTISFTDLDNDTQYEVTVLAINNAGPATVVTTNVTTLTPSVPSPQSDLAVSLKFVDYRPIVTISWNASSLSHNMTEVEALNVSLTGEDDITTTFEVSPNTTTFQVSHNMTSDDNVSRHLDVGTDYIISVCSVNSVGCSETVSTSLAVRWLQSAIVQ
ncbi:fibronectin-like [Dysidea avara]|uniref:fibronectin-like n=1 Tax=Dysidea avara TaxID=196820 RepID=UPI00331E8571